MSGPAPLVMIGLCTFRRPGVIDTLASLDRQWLPEGVRVEIVVVDNDDAPTAQALVEGFARGAALRVAYLHRPARNISVARNGVLDIAQAKGAVAVACLDDDEIAPPGWIAALWARLAQGDAVAVLGPVRAIHGPDAPDWMQSGAVHDTLPVVLAGGEIRQGYTCNVIFRLDAPAVDGLRFDPARGTSGGEDTAFFAAMHAAGGRIAFAPDALLTEVVPPHRATQRWLLTRRFRMGQTHGSLIGAAAGRGRRVPLAFVAAAKVAACGAMALLRAGDPLARNRAILRGALHLGTLSALAGFRAIHLYGGPAQAPTERPT